MRIARHYLRCLARQAPHAQPQQADRQQQHLGVVPGRQRRVQPELGGAKRAAIEAQRQPKAGVIHFDPDDLAAQALVRAPDRARVAEGDGRKVLDRVPLGVGREVRLGAARLAGGDAPALQAADDVVAQSRERLDD